MKTKRKKKLGKLGKTIEEINVIEEVGGKRVSEREREKKRNGNNHHRYIYMGKSESPQ